MSFQARPSSVDSRLLPVNAVHGEVESDTAVQVVADLYWCSTERERYLVEGLLYVAYSSHLRGVGAGRDTVILSQPGVVESPELNITVAKCTITSVV